MPIQNNQIEEAAKKTPAVESDPEVQTGEGVFYTKVVSGAVEGFFKDDQGNAVQLTNDGSPAGAGAVSSVNGETGVVVLTTADISVSGPNIYFTSAEQTKLAEIATGAEVNPDAVSEAERDAGTEVALRLFSPFDVADMVATHSGGGGAVSSVNGETGAVVLDADDIDDTSTVNKFTTAGDISKLAAIEAGAEVNPDLVSQAEAEAGVATTERTWSAERVAQAIAALAAGGSSVDEFRFLLPAAADLATRIGSVSGLPAGWSLDTADNAAEAQFGSDAETLVITWDGGLGNKIAKVSMWQVNTGGPAATQGVQKIELSGTADEKTKTDKTKAAVYLAGKGLQTTRDLEVFVKLV